MLADFAAGVRISAFWYQHGGTEKIITVADEIIRAVDFYNLKNIRKIKYLQKIY